MPLIYAHRGASTEFPENTLAAFNRALELGADGIELDLHLSADQVPVVIHDPTLDRTTNGTGRVADLTVAELQCFDAGAGERIPTLAEVLDLLGDRVRANLELKTIDAAPAMLAEVLRRPGVRWATSCFDWRALELVRATHPDADCWIGTFGSEQISRQAAAEVEAAGAAATATLIRERAISLDTAIAMASTLGSSTVSIFHRGVDAESVRRLHDAGLDVWAWTINDPVEAARLIDLGVDGICTDDPAALLKLTAAAA